MAISRNLYFRKLCMLVLWATFHKEIRKRNPLFIASVLVTWAEERAGLPLLKLPERQRSLESRLA